MKLRSKTLSDARAKMAHRLRGFIKTASAVGISIGLSEGQKAPNSSYSVPRSLKLRPTLRLSPSQL